MGNFLFCFTKSRSSQFKPGPTLPALKAMFKSIKAGGFGDKVFCLDNEAQVGINSRTNGVAESSYFSSCSS